jgi:hypothetical protein
MNEAIRRALLAYWHWPERNKPRRGNVPRKPAFGLGVRGGSAEDGAISVVFTFRSGDCYCCSSAACHYFNLFFRTDWDYLRELLHEQGVQVRAPMKFVVRVVTERGALFAEHPGDRVWTYRPRQTSSWAEYVSEEARPTDSQEPVRSSAEQDGPGSGNGSS